MPRYVVCGMCGTQCNCAACSLTVGGLWRACGKYMDLAKNKLKINIHVELFGIDPFELIDWNGCIGMDIRIYLNGCSGMDTLE